MGMIDGMQEKYGNGQRVKLAQGTVINLGWHFCEEKIEAEKTVDGCYIIFTDVAG
ncbi:MAG: hypothetical protein FWG10_02360 [Eubacteriaceae bacterium]|nr:hypothetical protein [Eubacteriaceae bacterium]